MRTRRRYLRAIGAAALPVVAGCSSDEGSGTGNGTGGTPTLASGTATVAVGPNGKYVFRPGTTHALRVTPGTKVTFAWKSDNHNVHVTNQPADANWQGHDQVENTGFEFTSEFTVPGTYEYVCQPHEALGMTGTLVVEEDG